MFMFDNVILKERRDEAKMSLFVFFYFTNIPALLYLMLVFDTNIEIIIS